jgi:hypothetical protein
VQQLMLALSRSMVPLTLLHYPTLVTDADYLYHKLAPAIGALERKAFDAAFVRSSRPELVHRFARHVSAVLPQPLGESPAAQRASTHSIQ